MNIGDLKITSFNTPEEQQAIEKYFAEHWDINKIIAEGMRGVEVGGGEWSRVERDYEESCGS